MRSLPLLAGLAAGVLASAALAAPSKPDPALHDQELEILKRGIAFKTSAGAGNTVAYAEYLKGQDSEIIRDWARWSRT